MPVFGKLLASLLTSLALILPAGLLAATGAPGVPAYHIVRESRPDMTRYAELLEMRIGLCALAAEGQGRPRPNIAIPTAALLAKHAAIRVEQWFDGERFAEFRTQSFLTPDLDKDCQLALVYDYGATVQPGRCEPGVHGVAGASGSVKSSEPPRRPPDISRDEPMTAEVAEICLGPVPGKKPRKLRDPATLAKQATASGVSCVWEDEVLGLELSPESKGQLRHCLHAGTPFYPVPSGRERRRAVVLKEVGHNFEGQKELAILGAGIGGAGHLEAVSVRVLDKAPDSVFSEAAVEKHIRQPLWTKWPLKP